ncbi:hypothetical protein B0H14DRAFT_2576265 [Mycena olivaceomarginata]|nr:hypothetical protein B0H14DRAFT_2576265 [Mycena olivaceomarginata]
MPAVRRNHRLQNIVRTSLSNPVAIAAIPDPYPSDRPGLNYIVTHDLALPPTNWASSTTRLYSQALVRVPGVPADVQARMEGLLHHTRAQADGTFGEDDARSQAPHRMLLPKTAHGVGELYVGRRRNGAGGPVLPLDRFAGYYQTALPIEFI